jgi:hypothetical protein
VLDVARPDLKTAKAPDLDVPLHLKQRADAIE